MTDIADRYEKNARAFLAKVAAVPEDAWDAPTPCPDWTATDLVQHVVESQGMFLGFIGEDAPEGPAAADDPVAAVQAVTGAIQAALEDDRAQKEFEGAMGRSTFEGSVDR